MFYNLVYEALKTYLTIFIYFIERGKCFYTLPADLVLGVEDAVIIIDYQLNVFPSVVRRIIRKLTPLLQDIFLHLSLTVGNFFSASKNGFSLQENHFGYSEHSF